MKPMVTSSRGFFRGQRICQVPGMPGLYAWYYRPCAASWENVRRQLKEVFQQTIPVETCMTLRYGVVARARALGHLSVGSDDSTIDTILGSLELLEQRVIGQFLHEEWATMFMRPLYIGISTNLRTRVYEQHYEGLVKYWESGPVSRFLGSHEDASVQDVMDHTQVGHSFALEARVRRISSRDLVVYVQEMPDLKLEDGGDEEPAPRRALERLLQLITDPVCGRRQDE